MSKEREPQSFAHVLAEADAGLLNRQLSEIWQGLSDALDQDSMTHDKISAGAITITLKVTNDRGKVLIVPTEPKVKYPPRLLTGARFYRDEEGNLSAQDPRVAHDLFAERARAAKEEKRGKSAAAPVAAEKAGA